ncbi:hypothetical protein [Methylocystis iwaonis]|uniref:hypothetical protein n=1 Tax=Methylocystis iwaonis TaxID=2885079 RepID=UPI002E7B3F97|nr:hypothetical protein [Methylocystis iwaonis]
MTKPFASKPKSPDIGLRQAKRLCQMPHEKRLDFIAEGLPIILQSARGFWSAAKTLKDHPREAAVVEGFALEEAAKILILMDMVRCPRKQLPARIGAMVGWFYDHLARIIYAEATDRIRATDVDYLRGAIEHMRKTCYLEGNMGEYILPNWELYIRESRLYADIEAYGDGDPGWSAPHVHERMFKDFEPTTIKLIEAMASLGLFTLDALTILSEVWDQLDFEGKQDHQEATRLVWETLERAQAAKLIPENAAQDDANLLARHWQLPMYALDLSRITVSLEELEAEQEQLLWAEIGYP